MPDSINSQLRYLTISQTDEDWGIVVTTAGSQFISPQEEYPLSGHPEKYLFQPQVGRILNEYQLVYITKGSGFFSSRSCKNQKVRAGTMILLFPGEWHSYYPDKDNGWDEYWVGFRGIHIDKRVEKRFFTKEEPLHNIGLSATIISLYEDIFKYTQQEKIGCQQIVSSIVLHILGLVYYKDRNNSFNNSFVINKINEARLIMKEHLSSTISGKEIADQLGVGYSWFRQTFKEYTGISPAQYQIQIKLQKAKELLISSRLSISEIAFQLGFENAGQFATFFRNKENVPPSLFRKRAH